MSLHWIAIYCDEHFYLFFIQEVIEVTGCLPGAVPPVAAAFVSKVDVVFVSEFEFLWSWKIPVLLKAMFILNSKKARKKHCKKEETLGLNFE